MEHIGIALGILAGIVVVGLCLKWIGNKAKALAMKIAPVCMVLVTVFLGVAVGLLLYHSAKWFYGSIFKAMYNYFV